ncbi:MAG TPA: hypothetical protein PKC05_03275 [Candidatus Saccharibacteria bacterium]|jgi:hypothetical protein|nr:hypothetical protein [Candidatus Saccharibacteria bacterium]
MEEYRYRKYTTTELIKLLQDNERGAVSGRPREITFWVNGKPYDWLVPDAWGDGLVTDIGLYLKSDSQIKQLKESNPHKPVKE